MGAADARTRHHDGIADSPATRKEHRSQRRQKQHERQAEGTSSGQRNRAGRTHRSRAESTPTSYRAQDREQLQDDLAKRRRRRAEAPTTPTAKRGPIDDQDRQEQPAPVRRRRIEGPGQRRNDGATRRETTAVRQQTMRWTAQPVTEGEPENAIQREPPATPPRARSRPPRVWLEEQGEPPRKACAESRNAGSRRPPTDRAEGPRARPGSDQRATLGARGQDRIDSREADHKERANACGGDARQQPGRQRTDTTGRETATLVPTAQHQGEPAARQRLKPGARGHDPRA